MCAVMQSRELQQHTDMGYSECWMDMHDLVKDMCARDTPILPTKLSDVIGSLGKISVEDVYIFGAIRAFVVGKVVVHQSQKSDDRSTLWQFGADRILTRLPIDMLCLFSPVVQLTNGSIRELYKCKVTFMSRAWSQSDDILQPLNVNYP